MSNFQYGVASSVSDAIDQLSKVEDGYLLAGGMTLIPAVKLGLNSPSKLIDLSGAGLGGIEIGSNAITIGSMTRHVEVESSGQVTNTIPALAELAGQIGDPQVRNRGTLGGSIANNDPAADYPAACLGLGAMINTNKREIIADDFFTGLFSTALEDGEIILSVSFPVPEKAAYVKFPNPATRYALVGVFVAAGSEGVRVAVTGAGSNGVYREREFEGLLNKNFSAKSLDGASGKSEAMTSDIHAASDYRAHLVGEIARRAVGACA